jgi:hypothetical protein
MIINGGSRRNGAFFKKHLTNAEFNERVTLCEMRNLAATNIADAFREMEAVAMGTLCRNYFYHANINPTEGEELSAEQWQIAVDTLERYLGLEGHARFVVEHRKKGRTHRHVIWSRIDARSMRAAVMADDYAKHQAAARELEKAFGLTCVESVLGPNRPYGSRPSRRPAAWETFRGQTSGIDPFAMKQALTRLYRECGSAAEFAERLSEGGLTLVKGNRADFCIRDSAGHLHSLTRRIDCVKAADLRSFLRDLAVPSLKGSVD